ncbi:UDP-N-acetylmuramoyl-tripeptide--D-alanyl-D-alanine ligase [Ornatilinea apprima]|uniref:UDP-N-acetylmuramoyl-tripeptide--D-alanyl-D- alanine ligase n=1 Tax=Ornatilinea apprima TaxID=1134406 RepID=UPI0009463DF8|nr:UDP-N-acetylmuramoyl-tripeptide--D-alanyl-D-alanine ligase [Ornatilinea apprima]
MILLADLIEALSGVRPPNAPLMISEAAVDSRQVIPAGLFVALPGERVDGHDYVEEAFRKGASVALVQKDLSIPYPTITLTPGQFSAQNTMPRAPFCIRVENTLTALQKIAQFWRSKLDLRVIGITGSVGKSTTKELVAGVLSQRYRTLKNIGNLNNEIGLPLTILRLGPGHQRAVLEMGFYVPGEIALLCEIARPHVGIVTNIGAVHAERAGSIEAIARGKSELVQALPPAPAGTAILNYDDDLVRPMANLTHANIFFYGLDPKADLWADQIESLGLEGIRFRLHYRKESIQLRAPLIGQHSVHTALRAAAVGLVEGLKWQEIVTGLQKGHTQLRLVTVRAQNGALLLDDTYNASPESTLAALNLLGELEGRKIAVLGDMLELGQYEEKGHHMVGVRAAEVCAELIAVGERSQMIVDGAKSAGMRPSRISWVSDVPEAIELLKKKLKANDVVLLKGSHGLHMERITAALEADS